MAHLPECRLESFSEWRERLISEGVAAEDLEPAPAAISGSIVYCAEGCPELERTLKRGRELAEKFGW